MRAHLSRLLVEAHGMRRCGKSSVLFALEAKVVGYEVGCCFDAAGRPCRQPLVGLGYGKEAGSCGLADWVEEGVQLGGCCCRCLLAAFACAEATVPGYLPA